jgi:hypothetical protein
MEKSISGFFSQPGGWKGKTKNVIYKKKETRKFLFDAFLELRRRREDVIEEGKAIVLKMAFPSSCRISLP